MLHLSVNADADHLLASSHQRNTVLAQITLDQVQVTGGKGNKVAIGVIAYKDDCAGQVTLASQRNDLTRIVAECQRHIFADAVAGISFIEARQVTANVRQRGTGYKQSLQSRGLVFSYALAVSEENASGGKIVTAPTCGSCGVMPAVLYHLQKSRDFSDMRILRALATAGLIGNIVKFNASISGAEVGCQGEVGVACAMASAAANQLFGGSPAQIEYAAEMGLEHHLGMTCDPVCGLVQIPCIERNAYAAARALDANLYSAFTDGMHRVSFDKVVQVMKQTGHDLPSLYKETSEGGLAKDYQQM